MKVKIADLKFTGVKLGNLPFPLQVLASNDNPYSPEECVRVSIGDSPDEVANYMAETGVWNTIQDDPTFLNNRLAVSAHLIQNPKVFFEDPSKEILTPGLDTKSQTKSASERRWKFRSTAEKHFVMKMIQQYVKEIPGARGVAETVVSIADELFTNALFNAPFGDLDSTLDRSTLVVLDADMSADLIVGYTSDRLFLGCIDVFGALDCENLLKRIYRGFKAGISNSLNMNKGGAGIGILRMVDLSADVYVIVERNKKTLVGCSFALNRSPGKIRHAPKNFYFQSYQNVEFQNGAIRVERRGARGYLRMFGDISIDFPFSELDLTALEEIKIDLRLLNQDSANLQFFMEILRNFSSLKKVYFEYVQYNSVPIVENIIKQSGVLAEIGSIILPFNCPTCKDAKNILFIKWSDKSADIGQPTCSKCNTDLNPDNEVRQFIA